MLLRVSKKGTCRVAALHESEAQKEVAGALLRARGAVGLRPVQKRWGCLVSANGKVSAGGEMGHPCDPLAVVAQNETVEGNVLRSVDVNPPWGQLHPVH